MLSTFIWLGFLVLQLLFNFLYIMFVFLFLCIYTNPATGYYMNKTILWSRMFWHILRQNPSTALGCSELQEPPPFKKKTNTFSVRKVTHAQKRNALADRDELLHRCRGPRRNHVCRFVLRSLTGFGRGRGSNFGFLYWLASSPLQHSHYRASVWCKVANFM